MSGARLLKMIEWETQTLPEIQRLDEYTHYREQLETMRARGNGEVLPAKFAMELALYFRMLEYERSLGLPDSIMPNPDGKGGVTYPSIVPESWE